MSLQSQQYKIIENDQISLRDLILKSQDWFHYFLSKWLIIMIFSMLGAVLGFYYAYSKKTIYAATTTFVLEDEKGSETGGLIGLASLAGINLGGGGGIFKGDNILDLYKSRTMLEQTLLTEVTIDGKQQLLVDRFIDFNNLRKKWASKADLSNIKFSKYSLQSNGRFLLPNRLRDSVLGTFVDDINKNYLIVSKPDKKLGTIQVDMKSEDEFFSKAFNDELVKNVNNFYVTTKTKKTLETVLIMQSKADSIRKVMNGSIYSAVASVDATPNLNPTRQVQRLVPVQRAQFSAEANKAILGEMVKNLELAKLTLAKETPLIQVVDQPIYPLKTIRLGKIIGLVGGGVLAVFLIIILLVIKRVINNVLS